MKLTEKRLKEIILEELQIINEEEKGESDVQMVLKNLPRINTAKKYYQVMSELLNHDLDGSFKREALLQLKDLYLEQLKGTLPSQEDKK